MASNQALRSNALSLYRQIFRAAKQWPKAEEREYIRTEARTLFHKNLGLTKPEDIQEKLFEGESRLALATHYGIAAPRLFYAQPVPEKYVRKNAVKNPYMRSYQESQ